MLSFTEREFIKLLMRANGAYVVAEAVSQIATETSQGIMKDNEGAIIHSDAKHLNDALALMKASHPIRNVFKD